ncbi:peptidase cysteine serine trypsin protein [Rutstroemia sp. NJR-2017a BVV2]|nr:peptidase cysteine serine trypsin protein [Rutstroemia sp. NJR-2017a BVV2]PQE09386.1 peptidase cysteine serine trypsin protein [Rutstroemia sp. NJR-2017a BVV2]
MSYPLLDFHSVNMPDLVELPRFPPLTPANKNLNGAQGAQYEYLADMTKKTRTAHSKVPSTSSCDHSLLRQTQAPNANTFTSYTPTIVQPWVSLQLATAGLHPATEAEAAAMGVLSVTHAKYGIYAHSILAEKAGYSSVQVKEMLEGRCPADIGAREAAVYKLAVKLAQTRGPLDGESYDDALEVLGREGVLGVVQKAAAFMHASILMNAGNVGLPKGT